MRKKTILLIAHLSISLFGCDQSMAENPFNWTLPKSFIVIDGSGCSLPVQWRYSILPGGVINAGPPVVGDAGGFTVQGQWIYTAGQLKIHLELTSCAESDELCETIGKKIPPGPVTVKEIQGERLILVNNDYCEVFWD